MYNKYVESKKTKQYSKTTKTSPKHAHIDELSQKANIRKDHWINEALKNEQFLQCYKGGSLPLISPDLHTFRQFNQNRNIGKKDFYNYSYQPEKERIPQNLENIKSLILPKMLYQNAPLNHLRNSDLRKIRSDTIQYTYSTALSLLPKEIGCKSRLCNLRSLLMYKYTQRVNNSEILLHKFRETNKFKWLSNDFKLGPIKYKQNQYDMHDVKDVVKPTEPQKTLFCSTIPRDVWNTTLKYTNSIRSDKDLTFLTSINKSNSRGSYDMRKFEFSQNRYNSS